ncbi:MAG: TnsA endonuclease N-terminal domain-containing protein [Promethearchaeota archaeon]
MDHDPNCIDLQTQPCHVPFTTKSNRKVKATPDIWAVFRDGRQFLFEVKPEKKIDELQKNENWQVKTDAIIQYCRDLNLQWTYKVITERKIRCVRLNNIKDMLGAAKHYSPVKIDLDTQNFEIMWKQALRESPMTFRTLVDHLETKMSIKKSEIISLLKYKIYFNYIDFDWDIPFNEATFSMPLNNQFTSDYLRYNKGACVTDDFASLELDEITKAILPSEEDQQAHDNRISLISSIIENYGQNAKRSEIQDLCQKKGLSFHSAYKWYLIWKNEGSNGLYPKRSKAPDRLRLLRHIITRVMIGF